MQVADVDAGAHRKARAVIHLSVAIGRFVEALFWAIVRVAGWVTVLVAAVALAAFVLFLLGRWIVVRTRTR